MKTFNITLKIDPKKVDLEHMLESVTDATSDSDNVTVEEHDIIIDFMIQLIKQNEKK